MIESYSYFNYVHRLSTTEILQAAKKDCPVPETVRWVTETSQLENAVDMLAKTVMTYVEDVLHADKNLIERTLNIREKRIEQAVRKQYEESKAHASMLAAKAFMNKDYQRVIELVRPFEHDLGDSDRKKLNISLRKLLLED